eukprot:253264_1
MLQSQLHNIHLTNAQAQQSATNIRNAPRSVDFNVIKDDIKIIWHDENMLKLYREHRSIGISESYKYFFDQVDTIAAAEYQPTKQDIIYSYIPTTGILSGTFVLNDQCTANVFDTG